MELIFEKKKYISYHVYSVTKIKNKYGFRIVTTDGDIINPSDLIAFQ